MRSVEQLELQARERRKQLRTSSLALRGQLTLAGLANEALGLFVREWFHPSPAIIAAKRRPFLSVVLMTAASWIVASRIHGLLTKPAGSRGAGILQKRRG